MNSFIKSVVKISRSVSNKLNDIFSTKKNTTVICKPISVVHVGELSINVLKSLKNDSCNTQITTTPFKTYKSSTPQKFTFTNVTFSMSPRFIISSVDDEPFRFIKINRAEKKSQSLKLVQKSLVKSNETKESTYNKFSNSGKVRNTIQALEVMFAVKVQI